ncbi:DUF928 domain-containing protein [Iningainema sp. BLCCT55]|uniref:DUF928 domain-containing protein n=2 Tax=Iningainema TaxID=1932705 RepID=A0A8J7C7A6_9CYAN|nr:DUF928 domain-containing protein [Iningainema tapete BLCC-T55]
MSCAIGYGEQRIVENPNLTLASIKFQPPPPPPPPPPTRGEPTGRAQGGAGRGCEPTALVPSTKTNNGDLLWGLTVAERPQFWFSLPRNLTTKDAVEFVLKDNQGKEVYKNRLENINTPKGIISIAIPQQIPPLQTGKTYKWSFSIYCDFKTIEDRPGNVRGSIQRATISTTLKNQLANAKTPIEQANVYAQNGIWFDALTVLAVNIRNNKEKDVTSAWTQLLEQANLKQVVSLPVTDCCTKATVSN